MIIEGLFNLIACVINLIPFSLPDLPVKFNTILDMILNYITQGLTLINIFIRLDFWFTMLVIALALKNIKHIWNSFIWLLNLIPSVQIGYWN